jgi:mono/diheme cytochrome c family protein
VASWTSSTTAAHVIAGWGAMPSMGGENLDSAIRAAVLDELGAWAASRLGDLDRPQAFTETYVVEGVRLL